MTGPYRFCTSCHIPCLIQATAQCRFKEEKILKGSLDSILSHSPLFFFDFTTLGVRAEICQMFSLIKKFILKLSDL